MATIREMVLQAEGITCAGCACDMEVVLLQEEGVMEVSANYASETICVKYDPLLLDRKAVFSAVRGLGCRVRIVEER